MSFRLPAILFFAASLFVQNAVTALAYRDGPTTTIHGHKAGAASLLVTFLPELIPADIDTVLAKHGMWVHSYHTNTGAAFSPKELFDPDAYRAADFTFVLVEFRTMDLPRAIKILEAAPEVLEFAPNYLWHTLYQPNDPYYSPYQGNFRQIGAERAWDISKGAGAVVAVIDSGYRKTGLEDRGENILTGYDFWGSDSNVNDYIGHGTHVSNTIVERTNNATGAAGLAFKATLLPVKVFPDWDEGAYEGDIIDAIYWATDQGADVINLSLGGGGYVSYTNSACNYARNRNVVVFASSGNDGVSPVEYPGAYNKVVAVGSSRPHSLGSNPQVSDFSNWGSDLDIVAPGEEIVQETYDLYYNEINYFGYSGTSMSAPHAAAVAALMIANGADDADDIVETLYETALKAGTGWDNRLGWGEINAYEAVRRYGGSSDDDDDDDDSDDDDDDNDDDDWLDPDDDDAPWDDGSGEPTSCSDLVNLIYNTCALTFMDEGDAMSGDTAYAYCNDGQGNWECIFRCAGHEKVDSCDSFAQCLDELCGVANSGSSSKSDSGDDDEDAASCGC